MANPQTTRLWWQNLNTAAANGHAEARRRIIQALLDGDQIATQVVQAAEQRPGGTWDYRRSLGVRQGRGITQPPQPQALAQFQAQAQPQAQAQFQVQAQGPAPGSSRSRTQAEGENRFRARPLARVTTTEQASRPPDISDQNLPGDQGHYTRRNRAAREGNASARQELATLYAAGNQDFIAVLHRAEGLMGNIIHWDFRAEARSLPNYQNSFMARSERQGNAHAAPVQQRQPAAQYDDPLDRDTAAYIADMPSPELAAVLADDSPAVRSSGQEQAYRPQQQQATSSAVQDRGQEQGGQPQQQGAQVNADPQQLQAIRQLKQSIYNTVPPNNSNEYRRRLNQIWTRGRFIEAAQAMRRFQEWDRRRASQRQAAQSSDPAMTRLAETMQGNQVTGGLQRAQTMPGTPASGGERRPLPSEAQTPSTDLYGDSTTNTPQPALNQSQPAGNVQPPTGGQPYLERGGPARAGVGQPLYTLAPAGATAQPSLSQSTTWPAQTRASQTRAAQNITKEAARTETRGGPSTHKVKSGFSFFGGSKKGEVTGTQPQPTQAGPSGLKVNTKAPLAPSGNTPISVSSGSSSPSPVAGPSGGKDKGKVKGKGKAPTKKGWGKKK